ncbi:hypothetical protein BGX38DRAFT_1331852 [Terfezia claveryi]|nr:hypothetical protein BGX38DRAFT_1331852 [Terfezia claveryi]
MEKTSTIPSPSTASSVNGQTPVQTTKQSRSYSSIACVAERLAVDAAAAGTAAALVAPLITIIDQGIMENASGKRPLVESVKAGLVDMVKRPHRFLWSRPFGLIFTLYSSTYLTANSIDTIASLQTAHTNPRPSTPTDIKTVTTGTPKPHLHSALFNPHPRPVPLPTYFLFSARDTLTIFFSFNLPPLIAPVLPINPKTGMVAGWEKLGWDGWRPQTVTQMVAPAVCQVFSTPLHLLGLDLYNRPRRGDGRLEGGLSRWARVRKEWVKSAVARMGRIVPAFGVGGVVNAGVRRWGLEGVERRWR